MIMIAMALGNDHAEGYLSKWTAKTETPIEKKVTRTMLHCFSCVPYCLEQSLDVRKGALMIRIGFWGPLYYN